VRAASRFATPQVAAALIEQWPGYTPKIRAEVLDGLVSRVDRATALLGAIRDQKVRSSDLSAAQIAALRNHSDKTVGQLAARTLAPKEDSSRAQVIEKFKAALELAGQQQRGRAIYLERCASCHRSGNEGQAVGPDLASVRNSGKEKLLIDMLDPNREVPPQYLAYTIETKDGETLTGIISSESGANVTLLQPNGKPVSVSRAQIKHLESQRLSLMPEGLEMGLSSQQMADLLAFVLEGS
jgi:putative heme-binding domain-containing protein